MDRITLTVIATLALVLAVLLGWGLRWIYDILNPPPPPEPVSDSEWAEYAKACETHRDEIAAHAAEVERDLTNKLTQANAERDTAMDGLGEARRNVELLEAELASLRESQNS